MSILTRSHGLFLLGRVPASEGASRAGDTRPAWEGADPTAIGRALRRALRKPSGGWVVVDATRTIRARPRRYELFGREWAAWWCKDGPLLGPEACPHMGAALSGGRVDAQGRIVCPWHGLVLGPSAHAGWRPRPTFDDGVLTWARFDEALAPGETPTAAPILGPRPARAISGVVFAEARCRPEDVIQNRLDPWHGAHFHPHSFARLSVLERSDDAVTVRVVYRIAGPLGMEVDARFECPEPRTIAMTIVAGEGVGSVVETHASPIDAERTAVVEATIATTERPLTMTLMRGLSGWLRPFVEGRARRLWVDDVAYCERLAALRARARKPAPRDAAHDEVESRREPSED